MTKKIIIISFLILITILILLPLFTFNINSKLIYFSYKDDYTKYEDNSCYNENYFYNQKYDVSIYNFDTKKILFFYIITLEYKNGNVCETEYLLEEEYINNVIENAEIIYNNKNIDLKSIIKDKKAIVSNTRYLDNNYETIIEYKLGNRYETMYVFYKDDLTIIQVGLSDEGPKFIAYK